jgi:hypothetical protein
MTSMELPKLRVWQYIALAAFAAYVASVYVRRYIKQKKINALGGPAARVKTRFIFG